MKEELMFAHDRLLECIEVANKEGTKIIVQCHEEQKEFFEMALQSTSLQVLLQQKKLEIELQAMSEKELTSLGDLQAIQLGYAILAEGFSEGDKAMARKYILRSTVAAQMLIKNDPARASKMIAEYSTLSEEDYDHIQKITKQFMER